MLSSVVPFGILKAQDLDIDQLRAAVQNHNCLSKEHVARLDANAICDPNNETERACDAKYTAPSTAWQQCYGAIRKCQDDISEKNQIIFEYNMMIDKCWHTDNSASSPTDASASPAQHQEEDPGSLLDEFDRSQVDANKAESDAKSATDSANNKFVTRAEELQQWKSNAQSLPAACTHAIDSCRERITSFADLDSDAQSACEAYCQSLEAAFCDLDAPSVQQSGAACANSIESDESNAMQQQLDYRRREHEQEHQNSSNVAPPQHTERNSISDGWTCFDDYESCVSYCNSQTGVSGTAGWCGGICSEDGTRNMPKPSQYGSQRCYHGR